MSHPCLHPSTPSSSLQHLFLHPCSLTSLYFSPCLGSFCLIFVLVLLTHSLTNLHVHLILHYVILEYIPHPSPPLHCLYPLVFNPSSFTSLSQPPSLFWIFFPFFFTNQSLPLLYFTLHSFHHSCASPHIVCHHISTR